MKLLHAKDIAVHAAAAAPLGFLALPIGRLSDLVGRRPIAVFAMTIDLAAVRPFELLLLLLLLYSLYSSLYHRSSHHAIIAQYYFATVAAQTAHQPKYINGHLMSSLAPDVCGYACFAGLLDGAARSLIQCLQAATISTMFPKQVSYTSNVVVVIVVVVVVVVVVAQDSV